MEIKCKPEKIEETLKRLGEFFKPVKILVSKSTWDSKFDGIPRDRRTGKSFGSERKKAFSGVPVEFSEEAGSNATIVTEEDVVKKSEAKKSKAKK